MNKTANDGITITATRIQLGNGIIFRHLGQAEDQRGTVVEIDRPNREITIKNAFGLRTLSIKSIKVLFVLRTRGAKA